jgi:hypothetical protein
MLLNACHSANRGSLPPPAAKAADAIAAAVVGKPAQSTNYVGASVLGEGQVLVGEQYFSALGLPCRRATFLGQTGQGQPLAVCAEKNGVWATAPDIFMASAQLP